MCKKQKKKEEEKTLNPKKNENSSNIYLKVY